MHNDVVNFEIPDRLKVVVAREIEPDEKIVWAAMPKARFITAISVGLVLFAIPWTAFAVFWMFAAAGFKVPQFDNGKDLLFALFGLPFVAVGMWMLSAPIWAYRNARNTVYIITDRRAVTIDGGMSYTIRSYTPRHLNDIFRREHRDGTGDVIISRDAWKDSEGDRQVRELGFLRVPNAKSVESLLREMAEQADDSRPSAT